MNTSDVNFIAVILLGIAILAGVFSDMRRRQAIVQLQQQVKALTARMADK